MDTTIINQIITALGLTDLSPEENADIVDRIGTVAIEDILTRATDALPEDKQDAYMQLLDTNPDPDTLFAFFEQHIPTFDDIVQTTIDDIAQRFK